MKISELPKEYKQLALKYREENKNADYNPLSLDVAKAFSWSETPEGDDFWYCVYEAKTTEELPPLPIKKKKSEWNLASEKEPPEGVLLIVVHEEPQGFRGRILTTYEDGKFMYLNTTPTHWFAVPELPEE